jgi:hypothetical protein
MSAYYISKTTEKHLMNFGIVGKLLGEFNLGSYWFNIPWVLVTTAWHILRLQMEEMAFKYGG